MKALELPAEDAPLEEWGRFAVSLPGWRWMPGMRTSKGEVVVRVLADKLEVNDGYVSGCVYPNPDDPATAGCLLEMLCADGRPVAVIRMSPLLCVTVYRNDLGTHTAPTLGRACIRAAAALGRWPNKECCNEPSRKIQP